MMKKMRVLKDTKMISMWFSSISNILCKASPTFTKIKNMSAKKICRNKLKPGSKISRILCKPKIKI